MYVYKNVKKVNENWDAVLSTIIGENIYDSCRRSIMKNPSKPLQTLSACTPEKDKTCSDDSSDSDDKVRDPSFQLKYDQLKRTSRTAWPNENRGKSKKGKYSHVEIPAFDAYLKEINDIRVALSNTSSRQDKIMLLTTLSSD